MANYKFIGGDGNEYGPYSAEKMREFLAQNRLTPQSQISADGGPMQPAANFPEIVGSAGKTVAAPQPAVAVPPPGAAGQQPGMPGAPGMPYGQPVIATRPAADQVNGPALFMMIAAGLNMAYAVLSLVATLIFNTALMGGGMMNEDEALMRMIIGIPGNVLAIIIGVLIIVGGAKMRKLESYGLAMAASILSIVCCPCCVGLGAGIWSLVVLCKPEVKAAFR